MDSGTNKALTYAILGYHETALSLLEKTEDFDLCLVKAQILTNLGRPEDAIKILDNTP